MKLLPLLLLVILSSCSQGEWVEYKYEIEGGNELSQAETENCRKVILSKLQKFGFRESKVAVKGPFLLVQSIIDLENDKEVENFKAIFLSTELELWDTYRVSDRRIERLDTDMLRTKNFRPNEMLGRYQEEVIGTCLDVTKLDEIEDTLSNRLSFLRDLRLYWSKERYDYISDEKASFKLYMINANGNENAPLTEQDLENASASEDEYQSDQYLVNFSFKEESIQKWSDMTERAANGGSRGIAIVINNEVQSVPRVMAPIYAGKCTVSGNFSMKEARELARSLMIGRLDYNLKFVSQRLLEAETQ